MARTIEAIYNEIVDKKDNQTVISTLAPQGDNYQQLLSDANSSSKVAIWRLWAWLISLAIATHENLFDFFRKEVQHIADSAVVGSVEWYVTQTFLFQYGDNLTYNSNTQKYGYSLHDTAKQIIKRCAIEEQGDGVLRFKVAKQINGLLQSLDTTNELPALISYLKKVRFAGTRFIVFTNNGDVLRLYYTIYYDPIIPLNILQPNVENAIGSYINALPFSSELLISKLTDEIQRVVGVIDVVFVAASASFTGTTFTAFTRNYTAGGGYFKIDSANPLANTLSYQTI